MRRNQTPSHSHTQNYSTYHSGYYAPSRGPSTVRVPDYVPPGRYAQPVTPQYYPQPLAQDGFGNITSMQFQRENDANWGIPMNGLNYNTTDTLGIGAPPPLSGGDTGEYYVSREDFGPAGINHNGFPFVTEPLSNLGTNIVPSFPGSSAAPSYQGASPLWKISNCSVSYETQDELHFTIVFRKVPSR
ncbi:hypothetical protein EI94DRAFT_1746892 [Lactarius quietus]|nr:hypothetical protein EI94DRAFT_1746892 [Lactarius quietus]